MVTRGPGRWSVNKKSSKHPGPIVHGQKISQVCLIQLNKSRLAEARQCSNAASSEENLLCPYGHHTECAKEVGSPSGIRNAMHIAKYLRASIHEGEGPIEIAYDSPYGETCKEVSSKYRKFYATWLRRKRQQQHEQ